MKDSYANEISTLPHGRRILPTLLATLLEGAACLQASQILDSSVPGRPKYEEYEARTAFLRVFAKYTEWPQQFLPPGAPLVIGVLGNGLQGSAPENLPGDNSLGREIVIKRFPTPAELQPCHILYFPAEQERQLPKLRGQLTASSVLTVGETSLFIEFGGALQLFHEEGRLRFTINQAILESSQLRVEAKALMLAKQVLNRGVEAVP